jgi:hypothetical protein
MVWMITVDNIAYSHIIHCIFILPVLSTGFWLGLSRIICQYGLAAFKKLCTITFNTT